jgi:hypothetical protein
MNPRYLAVAAIFRAENDYLREWLEYHLLAGVDHFFLYDNDGGEEAATLLAPYEAAGLVTLHPWTMYDGTRHDRPTPFGGRNKNHMAYAHAARHYGRSVTWLMKLDIDEFLVSDDGSLPDALSSYDPARLRGLRLSRYNFGDCGHRHRPTGLVIESYTMREGEPSNYKELASGRWLSANRFCNSAHRWHYRLWPWRSLLAEGEVTGLRINHYYTKSLDEYLQRQNTSRGRVLTEERFLERNRLSNAVADGAILRYLDALKARLGTATLS